MPLFLFVSFHIRFLIFHRSLVSFSSISLLFTDFLFSPLSFPVSLCFFSASCSLSVLVSQSFQDFVFTLHGSFSESLSCSSVGCAVSKASSARVQHFASKNAFPLACCGSCTLFSPPYHVLRYVVGPYTNTGDSNTPTDNLYISGLPSPAIDEDVLHGLFTNMGFTIVRSRCVG